MPGKGSVSCRAAEGSSIKVSRPCWIAAIRDARRAASGLGVDQRPRAALGFPVQSGRVVVSPVSKFAILVFACHTQTPSNWDSSVSILALLDIPISALNQRQWPTIHKRMGELEELRGNLSPQSHPQLPKNSAVE